MTDTMAAAEPKTGPRKAWYWLGGGMVFGGIVLGIVVIASTVMGIIDEVDDMPRVSAPGRETVTLEEGEATVYAEYEYSYGYGYGSTPDVTITNVGTGDELRITEEWMYETYDFGDHHGQSMGTIDVPADGRYEVVVGGEYSSLDGVTAVTIGTFSIGSMVAGIFAGIGLGGLVSLVGLVILIVVIVKRSGARKANRPRPAYAGGYGPPPGASYPSAYPPPVGQYPSAYPPPAPSAYPPPTAPFPAPPAAAPASDPFSYPPPSYQPPSSPSPPAPEAPDDGPAPML